MKTRMQLALMKIDDPRVVRVVLVGVALVLALVAQGSGVDAVYACPASGGGGCAGG